ncbi:alpha/beta fold hydrolase [Gramella sp. MAR_2010_147]|uniref:alpha/beta fold hydrolase n=1 Tax=Gramella sp. MAR_2010_147 TaxID=1250205 RepID=UPI00087D1A32|nr:alpha/beta fold hydrolase [Gramella sp. MAR_2010_147]SDR93025.1 proline iminopeptidase [Gramella sp. MAR_2010_147]
MNFRNIIIILFPLFLFSQTKGTVPTEYGEIAYQKFGSGDPVLIINGGPGMNSNGFAPLAEMISGNNTTIIYDQRGTGKSVLKELNASNISIDLMVEDIETLRKNLGYDQWIILGHSFGGMLAYAYAAKYPAKVKAMIQSHSGGMSLRNVGSFNVMNRLTEAESDSLVHYFAMMQTTPGNPRFEKKRAYFMAKAYLNGDEHEEAIAERLMQVNRDLNRLIWDQMRLDNFDKTAEMKNFQNKVLILHGLQDVVPVAVAEKAHQILPNSQLIKMEDCGHYGWLDQPEII